MIIADEVTMNEIKKYLDTITFNQEMLPVPDPLHPGETVKFENLGAYRSWFTLTYAQDLFDTAMLAFE